MNFFLLLAAVGLIVFIMLKGRIITPLDKSFRNAPKKEPSRLAQVLPWSIQVAPDVVLNKNGSFMAVIAYRGKDVDSEEENVEIQIRRKLNRAIMQLDGEWGLMFDVHHFLMPEPDYDFIPNAPVSNLFHNLREEQYSHKNQSLMELKGFLVVSLMLKKDTHKKLRKFTGNSNIDISRTKEIEQFRRQVREFRDQIEMQFESIQLLEHDRLRTYLHNTITDTPKSSVIGNPDGVDFLDQSLSDSGLNTIDQKVGKKHVRVLNIKGFPAETTVSLLDTLSMLDIPYRWTSRLIRFSREDSLAFAKKVKKEWFNQRGDTASHLKEMAGMGNRAADSESFLNRDEEALDFANDADAAQTMIQKNQGLFGYWVGNIVLMHEDTAVLDEWVETIQRQFNYYEMLFNEETLNFTEAWLGTIPGNFHYNPRAYPIGTPYFVDLSCVTGKWTGEEVNHVNDHVLDYTLMTNSDGALPFRFSPFFGDVGHMLVVGPTGMGKSTLLQTINQAFLRYPDSVVISFDKDYSAIQSCLGNNGAHYDISIDGTGLSFQPLRELENDSDRAFGISWIEGLILDAGVKVTPLLTDDVRQAIYALSNEPKEMRTLSNFAALCQNNDIKQILKPFTTQHKETGQFASVLDSNNEHIDSNCRWITFETSHLMQHPRLIAPVFRYLFHKLKRMFDGRPIHLPIDEGWKFLKDPQFVEQFEEWLRELRKRTVCVTLATQEPDGIKDHPLFPVISTSMKTKIFLPNDEAENPEPKKTYKEFGLNDRQIEIIANAQPKREYYLVQPNGCRLFNLGLDDVSLAFVGGVNKKNTELCKHLQAEVPKEEFAEHYLEHKGFPDYAELLRNVREQTSNVAA